MCSAEKRDRTVKGRLVCNGKPTREWLDKGASSSPTVGLDSLFSTMMMDAREHRDVMTADTPNAFMQTPIEKMDTKEKTVMKITGVSVDSLVAECLFKCGPCVACKNGKKVPHVEVP